MKGFRKLCRNFVSVSQGPIERVLRVRIRCLLGFGVPYFNIFFGTCSLKGTIMEKKVYTFFPLVTSKSSLSLQI